MVRSIAPYLEIPAFAGMRDSSEGAQCGRRVEIDASAPVGLLAMTFRGLLLAAGR